MSEISREINHVTLSGVVSGPVKNFSKDGLAFEVVLDRETGNPNTFVLTAYGESAKVLREELAEGKRLVCTGRTGREKLTDAGEQEDVISVGKVLAVIPDDKGSDFIYSCVGGVVSGQIYENVAQASGKTNVTVNIRTLRSFSKAGEKLVNVYSSFSSVTFWTETQDSLGIKVGDFIAVQGQLKGRIGKKKDTEIDVHRINLWVDKPRSSVADATKPLGQGVNSSVSEVAPKAVKPKRVVVPEEEDLPF